MISCRSRIFLLLSLAAVAATTACKSKDAETPPKQVAVTTPTPTPEPPYVPPPPVTTESGLRISELAKGIGTGAERGTVVEILFVARNDAGEEVDKGTLEFTVGEAKTLAGLDEGVVGLARRGKRLLEIPADLAWGEAAESPLPAGTSLKIEVERIDSD